MYFILEISLIKKYVSHNVSFKYDFISELCVSNTINDMNQEKRNPS